MASNRLRIEPLVPEHWQSFVDLFGPRGACGGCWCMTPRLTSREYTAKKGAPNRRAMKRLVETDRKPGVIGFVGEEPIGWCAIAPRSEYVRLETSRVLKPIDDQPVWSIVCLFVAKEWRRSGISSQMIVGAAEFARRQGARIVEAYPVVPKQSAMPDVFAWTGMLSAYLRAGFTEVARRSPSRPIVRREFE